MAGDGVSPDVGNRLVGPVGLGHKLRIKSPIKSLRWPEQMRQNGLYDAHGLGYASFHFIPLVGILPTMCPPHRAEPPASACGGTFGRSTSIRKANLSGAAPGPLAGRPVLDRRRL